MGLLPDHFPHRISAGGTLLFMRCVSLTLTGLISAWRRGEASSAILAKSLSDSVTVLCLSNANHAIWKFVESWKGHATFKMEYLTFLTGTFVLYPVGDANSTPIPRVVVLSPPPSHTHTLNWRRTSPYYVNWSRRSPTKIVPWFKQWYV